MKNYPFSEVYDAVLGQADPIPGLENAFAEGSFCAEQYDIMWEATQRLLGRLNQAGEDPDLEIIRGCLSAIQKEVCRCVYEFEQK